MNRPKASVGMVSLVDVWECLRANGWRPGNADDMRAVFKERKQSDMTPEEMMGMIFEKPKYGEVAK